MNDDELQDFEQEVTRATASLHHRDARAPYTQILLAYDGSADARAALERVASVASEGSEITVVTVIPYEAVGSKLDPIDATDRDWQWKCLIEATAYLRAEGIESFIEAAAGNPAPVICETARSLEADLVVLGNGHAGRRRPSLRQNPVRRLVQRNLTCDTLVVRASRATSAPSPATASATRQETRRRRLRADLGTTHPGLSR
jgi:nucleotide-binding universal stress UspA family protein